MNKNGSIDVKAIRKLAGAMVIASQLLASPAISSERLPTFPRKTTYTEARQSLIALGWQPIHLPESDVCEHDDPRCLNRPEMMNCSGAGLGPCIFVWKRQDTLIEIITILEDPAIVRDVRCRVGCKSF